MAAARKRRRRLGENPLKDTRAAIGISQKELAEELGLARTTIISAEQADPKPWILLACVGLGGIRLSGDRVGQLSGPRLTRIRTDMGLSAEELANRLGYAPSTINTWERSSPPLWAHPALVGLAVSLTRP